jgi:hypothetical protein
MLKDQRAEARLANPAGRTYHHDYLEESPMTATATTKTTIATPLDPAVSSRILEEGYGPGAWHGADMRAALADVSTQAAFWRPGAGRHNIAEIALHHAWCVRSVTGQLTGSAAEAFPLEGADWFDASDEGSIRWSDVTALVEAEHARLATAMADIAGGGRQSPVPESDRLDLVLGVTCHAIYHAGQIQLIKVLGAAR